MGLVFFGVLLFITSGLLGWFLHVPADWGTVAVVGFSIMGTWFIAFPWGYIGAKEDERSSG
jgi:hypothetical protein